MKVISEKKLYLLPSIKTLAGELQHRTRAGAFIPYKTERHLKCVQSVLGQTS